MTLACLHTWIMVAASANSLFNAVTVAEYCIHVLFHVAFRWLYKRGPAKASFGPLQC